MAEEQPVICSACGYELGEADDEIAHPDDPDAPEDAHFKVVVREDKEERLQCTSTGQLAKPLGPDDPDYPGNDAQEGGGSGPPTENSNKQDGGPPTEQERRKPQVYDFDEEKNQMDLLREVITNPSYGLDDDQITEIRAWAEDYGGQLPPDALEEIAGLMDGVQKQTAQLMRQRYELKINKWVRDQQSTDRGPSIGTGFAAPPQGVPNISPPSQGGRPSEEALEKARQEGELEGYNEGPSNSAVRENRRDRHSRRENRRDRRRDAMDKAAEDIALGAAENIGDQIGSNYGRMQNIIWRVLEAKAEKDPDWFLEKEQEVQESLGISLFDLIEPSEQKKREMEQSKPPQPQADKEADQALEQIMKGDETIERPETNNNLPPQQETEGRIETDEETKPYDGFSSDEKDIDDEFEEIFG